MYPNSKTIKDKKTYIIIIILLTILAAALLLVLERTGRINFFNRDVAEEQTQADQGSDINFNPPTETEQNAGDEKKQELAENAAETLPSMANVVIVDASQYNQTIEVRAFVSNVVENGTCRFTFSKDSSSFEKQTPANAEASSTPCASLYVPRSEFSAAGTWALDVTYTATTVNGSAHSKIEIQ
jgi:hypothetical protein